MTIQFQFGQKLLKKALLVTAASILTLSAGSVLAATQVTGFGSNPGSLNMYKYVPAGVPANAPLVVAMHGCTQTAAAYEAAGWNKLADTYKFYVVYPEQVSGNNQNKCFNWFEPGDIGRGAGEALSIKQMVDNMKANYSIDTNRVFVTGLSAGGYMVNVMLATYPDVFAGGAPFSGGPYKCATTMNDAFTCMSPGVDKTGQQWGDLIRAAYNNTGRKPLISIWHGDADYTVKQMNQTEEMQAWTNVHGISETPTTSNTVAGYPHKVYGNGQVEIYTITGMGHGTPVDPSAGCGTAGAYILDKKICSSKLVADFWGLTGGGTTTTTAATTTSTSTGGTTSTAATTTTTSTTTTTTVAATCYTASNYAHVQAGRAYNSMGTAKANGSNQSMGLYNMFYKSTLKMTGPNYYVVGTCP